MRLLLWFVALLWPYDVIGGIDCRHLGFYSKYKLIKKITEIEIFSSYIIKLTN